MIKGLVAFWAKNAQKQTPWEKARGIGGAREEAQEQLLVETWDPGDLEELATKGEGSKIRLEATRRWSRVGLKGDKAKWLALSSKDAEVRVFAIELLSEGKTTNPPALANIALNTSRIGDAVLVVKKLILLATKDLSDISGEERKKADSHKEDSLSYLKTIAIVSPHEMVAKPCFDTLFTEGKIKAKTADSMSKEAQCAVVKRAAASLLIQERK